jgi:hypothetical protein
MKMLVVPDSAGFKLRRPLDVQPLAVAALHSSTLSLSGTYSTPSNTDTPQGSFGSKPVAKPVPVCRQLPGAGAVGLHTYTRSYVTKRLTNLATTYTLVLVACIPDRRVPELALVEHVPKLVPVKGHMTMP